MCDCDVWWLLFVFVIVLYFIVYGFLNVVGDIVLIGVFWCDRCDEFGKVDL